MNPNDNTKLLQEIDRRLQDIGCIAPVMRLMVLSRLREASTSELESYVNRPLAWLERWIAPIEYPAFLDLANQFSSLENPEQVYQTLNLSSDVEWASWLAHAWQFQASASATLCCLANSVADTGMKDDRLVPWQSHVHIPTRPAKTSVDRTKNAVISETP